MLENAKKKKLEMLENAKKLRELLKEIWEKYEMVFVGH